MSLECSICERDLRGEHDKSCPRYYDATIAVVLETLTAHKHSFALRGLSCSRAFCSCGWEESKEMNHKNGYVAWQEHFGAALQKALQGLDSED